ncbi:MAG: hypothetical protein Q8Q24_00020, partial [bacterium]|nr:hypothetical protein [bacterium]
IAILGPIAGFIPAVAGFIIYLLTNNALFGGASVWLSLVSLLNLVPVGMMDGGRVLSAICFSCHRKIGYGFLMTGFIVSAVFTVWQSMGFVIFPIVGGLGLLIECANQEKPTIMTKPEVIKFSIIYLITAATVSAMIFYLMGNPQIYNMVSELTVK